MSMKRREFLVAGLALNVGSMATALAQQGGATANQAGRGEGRIAHAPRGDGGFGYDPGFLDPASGRPFAELPAEAKNAFSHRRRALDGLRRALSAPRA